MEFLQLKYFMDAAKSENFTHTANKFMVPTSAVSQSIKRLEREIGTELFERRNNKIKLSDKGREFFERVNPALAEIEDTVKNISAESGKVKGNICLLIRTNRRCVTKCIAEFKKLYPDVTFSIYHVNNTDITDCDIIIDSENLSDKKYERCELVDEKISIAVSKNNPLSLKKKVTVEELGNERFISMPENTGLYTVFERMFYGTSYKIKPEILCDDPYYIREYVKLDLGVALFPTFSWYKLDDGLVLLDTEEEIRRKTYMYTPIEKKKSKACECFCEMLTDAFKVKQFN